MPGELSPDGNYFWDGVRWTRAVSPDGAWRWDGRAWRPAGPAPPPVKSRKAVLIAVGVVAALLVGGLGVFGVVRVIANAQRSLQTQFSPACAANGTAGHALAAGDTLCGYRLGAAQFAAECSSGAAPDGLRAWRRVGRATDAVSEDITVDGSGCSLNAPVGSDFWLETATSEPADVVAVADYVPATDWGLLGIEVACNRATCLSLGVDPAGVYRIDEEQASGTWKIAARGALPLGTVSRLGEPNRLVVRLNGRGAQVYLNGYFVVRITTALLHGSGSIVFFNDNPVGTEPAVAHLKTLDVFASV
jgi:hypothetical protein